MKRRHFLQFASASLASIGLSQADFITQADRYGRAIAQNTPRKLALLIGINNYPAYRNLKGCVTDVDLQYHLLVHRFGFNPADIVKISDDEPLKPNRETILSTFQEHLIDQAKPGDVVVFHFSGHGSRVFDPNPIYADSQLNGTIVPNDMPPGPGMPNHGTVPDIMARTLFLLMRSLQTENVTAILDSCHSGGGLRGSASVRAVREQSGDMRQAMPEEFERQQELLEKLQLPFEDFQELRQAGIARGLGIGSAQFSELALDAAYRGFHAGSFTYLLTRYLWQVPGSTIASTVQNDLKRSTQTVAARTNSSSQIPVFQSSPESNSLSQPMYFTNPASGSAEAVVTEVVGDRIKFWLGGVSSQALKVIDTQARFTVLNDKREPIGEIEQTGREGLVGIGRLASGQNISTGMLLRETVVGLPANPQLVVGIDNSLGQDAEAAASALSEALVSAQSGQPQITPIRIDQTTSFDYLLGRMTAENSQQLTADGFTDLPPIGSTLLFTPLLEPLAATSGLADESISTAISRLRPKLKVLLANKVLKALSATHSNLSISGEVYAEADESRAIPIETTTTGSVTPFRSGERLRIRVKNNDRKQPVYLSCLAVNFEGDISVIYPNNWDAPEDAALIKPKSEIVLPKEEDNVQYSVTLDEDDDEGYLEVMTIASTQSLRNALRGLQEVARSRSITRGNLGLEADQDLSLVNNILSDINTLSRSTRSHRSQAASEISSDRAAVDGDAIAVFSTVIEVVK